MAYGTKYIANWGTENKTGVLLIELKDYVGVPTEITLHKGAINITQEIENWEEHIFGHVCEFDIVNDKANYFELVDLMIATERKYRITVKCTIASVEYILFTGYINTEAVTQRFLEYSTIHLVASSFISKLEDIFPSNLQNKTNITFIDIINDLLTQAGNTFPIRVCSFLRSSVNPVYESGKSFMNKNGINNEIFWENNVDKSNSYDVLVDILKSFECYMYFWFGCWYIESFDVLFNDTKYYAEYTSGGSYSPIDAGTEVVLTDIPRNDLHSLVFMDRQQTLGTIPGNRTVQVRINQKPYYNLTVNDFLGIVKVTDPVPVPPVREWRAYQPMGQTSMVWSAHGEPIKTMVNSIRRTSDFANTPNHDNAPEYPNLLRGLYTSFLITHDGITNLSIKWKYTPAHQTGASLLYYTFRWELQVYRITDDHYLGTIFWDEDTDIWRFVGSKGTDTYTYIEGSEFDKYTFVADININIPLGEITDLVLGDYKMLLIIKTESANIRGKRISFIETNAYYGDVQIAASIDTYDENVIEGLTNTDFIKKTTVEVGISDVPNRNYKNGVLQGDKLEMLTTVWNRNEATNVNRKLVDFILIDKFRTGSITRQQITSPIKSIDLLRPFSQYEDTKQGNKKFVLTSIRHSVADDIYDVVLLEYDNETEINLIEE